tara:strand:+ start:5142 stop:5330 length:189 start_codon:yes stop_codon:yes gene_type:complete
MLLGDLENTNKSDEEKLKYKERIAFATMRNAIPDWQPPSDWDSLPTKEKLKRLEKLTSAQNE